LTIATLLLLSIIMLGQSIAGATPSPFVAAQSLPDLTFETGDTTGWTVGGGVGTTKTAFGQNGSGVLVTTQMTITLPAPGGGAEGGGGNQLWDARPYGNYMAALQPSGGKAGNSFNDMTSALGLSAASVTALTTLLATQAQAAGGQPNPTIAAYIYRELTLTAG